jgi:hypothetical protein
LVNQVFKKNQLSRYHHRWFNSTFNPVSVSPSIHRNTGEQMITRSSSIMIEHIGSDRLISFIGWQRINQLYIVIEELVREEPPPTISTRIWDSRTWYIWSIYNYKYPKEAPRREKARSDWMFNRITSRWRE